MLDTENQTDSKGATLHVLMWRLSPPGQCVYCGGTVAKLRCDKCGWIDPPTKNMERDKQVSTQETT